MPAHDRRRRGATVDDTGTWFRVDSAIADGVQVALFDDGGSERLVDLEPDGAGGFVGHVAGVGAGARYGFRVHGPWDPARGHRCNPNKLLLDPYARSIVGDVLGGPALLGHDPADPADPSPVDSAPVTARSVVVADPFDWGDDRAPRTPMADTIVYETHVRGISKLHPEVPEEIRGTYAGLAHPVIVDHLTSLGVTAVELLPVHHFVQDQHLLTSGRRNYWGYNSIGFFAPHAEYAAGDPVGEFKTMVKTLHGAGLEVVLDVVYNHTAEGNHLGPTLSFRGLDNRAFYRLERSDPSRYVNWAGTGNTFDLSTPAALRVVLDSLRYWVEEMHVDGFRFDLAPILGRTHHDFDPLGGFFGAIAQDPVLEGVKLIAEPWDVGPDGYQLGRFPPGWSEWNDRYRDTVRDYWRSAEGTLAGFATAITGSSDLYEPAGRQPTASVNLVTSHDGFTLADLVAYEQRHNHANGEGNRDGHADNRSWNSGVEGPTTDPAILALRGRRIRASLATLLLSQGVPMLLGGDELGRTQKGNNNAYNQDGPLSWYHWDRHDGGLTRFVRSLTTLRAAHPSLRRTAWLHEPPDPGIDHVAWFTPAGVEMTDGDWAAPFARSVSLYLDGSGIQTAAGVIGDDDLLVMFNAYREQMEFAIPPVIGAHGWTVILDSAEPGEPAPADRAVTVPDFSVLVLARRPTG